MTTPDPFVEFDAAYVLGALSDAERAAFEAHLTTCPQCSARVAEIADLPSRLAGIPIAALLDADEAPPDTLLPGLLRRAATERRRRTWLVTGLAGLAAACVIALTVLVWPSSGAPAAGTPKLVAMSAVVPSPVHANAGLVDKRWGTEIDVACRYDDGSDAGATYWLVVIDKQGKKHPAGSWNLVPGKTMHFTGDTSVPQDQIGSLEITAPGGTAILRLTA